MLIPFLPLSGTNDRLVTACRDSEGSWIMVYTPAGNAFTLELGHLTGKSIKPSWYDPTAGTYTSFNVTKSDTAKFIPPHSNAHMDWVLVIESI